MKSRLHEARLDAVYSRLLEAGATTILDLGCGEGPLFFRLASHDRFRRLVGVDLSPKALRVLEQRLVAVGLFDPSRISLLQTSFTEPDERLSGFDAAILVETIEHVAPDRLSLVERAVFGHYRPAMVVVTTPNIEFNDLLGVPRRCLRHPDHRFEWTRRKFRDWSDGVGSRNGYESRFHDICGSHLSLGGATQMAVFSRL